MWIEFSFPIDNLPFLKVYLLNDIDQIFQSLVIVDLIVAQYFKYIDSFIECPPFFHVKLIFQPC